MKNRDPEAVYPKDLLIKNPYWRTAIPMIFGMAIAGMVLGKARQYEYR